MGSRPYLLNYHNGRTRQGFSVHITPIICTRNQGGYHWPLFLCPIHGSVIIEQNLFDSRRIKKWISLSKPTDDPDQITPEKTKPKNPTHPLRKKSLPRRTEFRPGVWRPPFPSRTIFCVYGFYFVESVYVCCRNKKKLELLWKLY